MSKSTPSFPHQIAVPVPLRQVYDYLASHQIEPGMRVVAPFGRRKLVGIVVSNYASEGEFKLKSVEQVLDQECCIDTSMLKLLRWASAYYHHPIGEVFAAALPARLRIAKSLSSPPVETEYRCLPSCDPASTSQLLSRAPRQRALFDLVSAHGWVTTQQIRSLSGDASGLNHRLRTLIDKGLIESRRHSPIAPAHQPFLDSLTAQQRLAIDTVVASLGQFTSFVLHGITGSGKTEVYLHITKACINAGQQAMVLVPEIALTPQLVARFTDRFGHGVGVIHSSMSAQQRYLTWWKVRAGHITIVLGTRSAIFTPMKNPGVIIIDEEHDISYKQQSGFRYHARDLAIKRASLDGVPIVLGSATPAMESMHNVASGRHRLLTLSHRIGTAKLPLIEFIDTKVFALDEGLSAPLLDAIRERLQRQQQTILYINRRGFAPIVQCNACAWRACCDRCDACLAFHKKTTTFRCHHCGKTDKAQGNCPQCGQVLFYAGIGTQRIENKLIEHFPHARIKRFDRDEINTQRKLEHALEQINARQVDIIIGTQLIVKGHDFPAVTLVGVIDPDQGLYSIDFRAPEYLFQQLVQVAGRSGRSQAAGHVMIQTAHPHNPYLHLIRAHDFNQFYHYCSEERNLAKLPPFAYLALWRAESTDNQTSLQFLQFVSRCGRNILPRTSPKAITIMEPISAPMEKRDGKFRAQLLVTATHRKPLHQLIAVWLNTIESTPASRKVRWSIDIDPMDMF